MHDAQISISGSLILLGVIQLMYRNSGPLNRNLAVAFFSLGYILLYLAWITEGPHAVPPLLANTESAMTFFAGPAIFLSVTTIVGERPNLPARHALHYIAPTAILAATIARNAVGAATGSPATPWDYTVIEGVILPAQAFSLAGNFWLLGYVSATIADALATRKRGHIAFSTQYALFLAILTYLELMALLFVATCFVSAPALMLAASYLCGVLVIVFGLLGFRYPEYVNRVIKAVSGQKKRRETLERRGAESLMKALVALMERKEEFRNPSLSIEDVAKELGVSAQLVSELVNRKTGSNFRAWINAWRVVAACERLMGDGDASILDVAFDSGFNSKSAFNAAFQEIAGKTPREFRKAVEALPGGDAGKIAQTLKLPSFVKSSVAK